MIVRLILVVCFLSTLVFAQGSPAKKDVPAVKAELSEIVDRTAEFQGRRIIATGDVISISADYQSMDIFDARSKAMVVISLSQLPRTQRNALINYPVYKVTVTGRVEMRKGRAVIRAEKISAQAPEILAKR